MGAGLGAWRLGGKFAFAKGSSHEQKVGEFLVTAEDDMLCIFKSVVKDKV